ncbi:MAG: SGNH/GDSL hydrolase family protein [Acidimicrobiia bacterium]|nr:SGNH/GDSL hydrolase family protein [Acidimicrobiia bacterium]
MRQATKAIVVLAVFAMALAAMAAPAEATRTRARGAPLYLALGDSWAYGQGATDPASGGYVAQLAGDLRTELDCHPSPWRDDCRRLRLHNLARPATDTLPGVTAELVASEQLPVALPILERRNQDRNRHNDVQVVTMHVGGNDVSGPIQAACIGGFTPECLNTWVGEMAQYELDLDYVVAELREAAGDEMPIVLGTYDNPVPFCSLGAIPGAAELGAVLLEGTPDGSLDGIHDIVRRVAASYDAEVAEVFGSLGAGDFVGGDDCLHITDSGHTQVADTFLDTIVN